MRKHGRLFQPALFLGAYAASATAGVDYTLNGTARFEQEYNTNIQLLRDTDPAKRATWGSLLAVNGSFSASAPTWQGWARARFDNYFYTPLDNLDRQNQIIDAGYAYMTERSRLEIAGNYTDDSLLATQTDLLDAGFLTAGVVFRQQKSISPTWSYALTEQTRLSLNYSYTETDYQSTIQNAYPNSSTHSATASLIHQLNSQFTLSGNFSYTHFATDPQKTRLIDRNAFRSTCLENCPDNAFDVPLSGSKLESQSTIEFYNLIVGLTYLYDPSLELSASAGVQYSQSTFTRRGRYNSESCQYIDPDQNPLTSNPLELQCSGDAFDQVFVNDSQSDDTLGPLFNLGARKTFDRSELNLAYSRRISPSINSQLITTDRVSLDGSYKFSETISGKLAFTYIDQDRPVSNGGPPNNQIYYTVRSDVIYHWSPQFSVGASYQYRLRDVSSELSQFFGTQDAHAVFVNLRYDFEKLQF